jgi:hypothetical protein
LGDAADAINVGLIGEAAFVLLLVFDELTDHALKVEVMPKTLTLGEAINANTRLIHSVPMLIAIKTGKLLCIREGHVAA